MPLQNRVTPFGAIVATPERGTLLGNRGILHDDHKQLVRTSQVKRWICCVLEFKNIHRTIMKPHSYTELFFLDEVTALAAGHRPCFECRRADARRFQQAWQTAIDSPAMADDMDAVLDHDRRRGNTKQTFRSSLAGLPDGTFFAEDGAAWLVYQGRRRRWTPGGYTENRSLGRGTVEVLTPKAMVKALEHYVPLFHHSVEEKR